MKAQKCHNPSGTNVAESEHSGIRTKIILNDCKFLFLKMILWLQTLRGHL